MSIHFEKASLSHIDIIFSWLAEPFVQEFWDNTQGHKDDILNFVNGRKESSNYCDGKYVYWIASCDGHPFAMLMTIQETVEDPIEDIKLNHLSKTGNTYGIDYMIGNKNYFGKGYGAKTLSEFIDFFRREFDVSADTFMIDPVSDNSRAKHVYMKAGFEHVADFIMGGDCSGAGKPHHLLIKRFAPNIKLLHATLAAIPFMVEMSYQKRRLYEKAQPQFWRYAGADAELSQAKWFEEILAHHDYILLTAESNQKIVGFIIGKLMPAPEVYNPGGLTLMIDDFCVADEAEWHSIGSKLVQEIKSIAKTKGAVQILVVCGAHDEPKCRFLRNCGLTVASEWYVGSII